MKYILPVLALAFLVACMPAVEEVATQPTPKQVEEPQTLVVEEPPEPVLEPVVSVPEPQAAPEPKALPEREFVQEQTCEDLCSSNCAQSAQSACTQGTRADCRAQCGKIIDPSACTTACAYLSNQQFCKQQLNSFCTSQCVAYCN